MHRGQNLPVTCLFDFGLAFVSVTASLALFFLIAVLYAVGPLLGRAPEITETT